MNSNQLHLSRLHFPVSALGPGRRIGIWMQGCSIRCPGCISMDTWEQGRGRTTVEAVIEAVLPWLPKADGFTISGGEPFDQPHALKVLLKELRRIHSGDVLVYSGYPVEGLALDEFAGLIDALISDPLSLSSSQTLPLRGSDNQRLHLLTRLGEDRFGFAHESCDVMQPLDIMFDEPNGDAFLAGIPRRGDLVRLQALLKRAGHRAGVTEDKR